MAKKTYFLETGNLAKCCSCGNCVDACPTSALVLTENKEGFCYPQLDEKKCIECGKCAKVCIYNNLHYSNRILSAYAVQNKDVAVLQRSSSGGVFFAVAKWIIEQGGVVFGCIFDTDLNPIITKAENLEQCIPMQGSKYVDADLKDSFAQVKLLLKQGRKVLFTGTPCSIACLLLFLEKDDRSNLYTLEFLCHGVPSRRIFKENIKMIEKEGNSKIVEYSFRDKSAGWGHATRIKFDNGRQKHWEADWQPYHYGYLKGYMNRYSCYDCVFAGEQRFADVTIGDFWGAYKYFGKEMNVLGGVSLLIVSTQKGDSMFNAVKDGFVVVESSVDDIEKENGETNFTGYEQTCGK